MGFTEVIRYRRDTWEAVSLLHPNGMTVGLMEYDLSMANSTNGASDSTTFRSWLGIEMSYEAG
jgi:hypothetical protein